jgi:tetratricopeptide (TPR) repeat protein
MPRNRPGSPAIAAFLAAALALATASCASAPAVNIAREWYELGNAWLDKGEWKRAGEAYSHAIALDPSFSGASFNLARALAEAGDYDGSLRIIADLAKRDPKNIRVLSIRAYALYKKGDAAAALKAYRAVLDLDPYSPDAVFNAALLELASGDASAAAIDLDRLTQAKPDDGQAFLLLARAYDAAGKSGESAQEGKAEDGDADRGGEAAAPASSESPTASPSAVAPPPPSVDKAKPAIGEKAVLAHQKALVAYEKARTLGKADAAALARLGELYRDARRYADAMDAYAAAVKAEPKLADSWFALARLRFLVASDTEQGLAALKGALDAGFSDKDAAKALLDEPDLPDRAKVLEALKAKDLAE